MSAALDARCSQCGEPFREHTSHLDPTERGGFRMSMTCPDPVSRVQAIEAAEDHADQTVFDAWRERGL